MAEHTENNEIGVTTSTKEKNEEKSRKFYEKWEITVYKGYSAKYKHEVYAVNIESLYLDAKKAFYLSDLMLNFNKSVKPFMALVGIVKAYVSDELQTLVDDMISKKDVVDMKTNIDSLFENSAEISETNIKTYCQNISEFIKQNDDLFAVKSDKSDDKNVADNTFIPKSHYGAYLENDYYKEKFEKRPKESEKSLLAVCTNKFKTIADIDEDKHLIKNVVDAFVKKNYILKGKNSSTIEKDLTLSRGNEVRCYVLDMDAINDIAKSEEQSI